MIRMNLIYIYITLLVYLQFFLDMIKNQTDPWVYGYTVS